jgi:predicted nucleotidyltransferase
MFGLPENVLKLLQNYFSSHTEIIKVYIYGSRAMGRETPGSDIDLAIVTKSDNDLSGRIKIDLEELPTPYLFDVVDYQRITHQPLREHIDRVGQIIYPFPLRSTQKD